MEIEYVIRIDGWLIVKPNPKDNEWNFAFCTCGINSRRTLSEAHETYNQYLNERLPVDSKKELDV